MKVVVTKAQKQHAQGITEVLNPIIEEAYTQSLIPPSPQKRKKASLKAFLKRVCSM